MKDFFSDLDPDLVFACLTAIIVVIILILGIAIPGSISEERNIEKEIKLKEIEMQYSTVQVEDK